MLPGNFSRRRSIMGKLAPRFAMLVLGVMAATLAYQSFAGSPASSRPSQRKLYEYPDGACNGYIETNYKWIVVGLLSWGIFYMFWALSIVCDDYFVASLEEICDALGLSPDVAGATFMAAGSSAPELFTSLMGVFAVKNDVGVGTIVGSAVFNLCCIIGGTAMFTPGTLIIDWKPITRDSFFYGLSIAAMIYVLADGLVTTVEAEALVAFYFVYVFVMAVNEKMMAGINSCLGVVEAEKVDHNEFDGKDGDEEDEEGGLISTAIAMPLSAVMGITIPDCSKDHLKSWYVVTFIMSILWIGLLSYYMVSWASKLGCIFGIHPAIMGCTILAAGTSVPDAIGSLIVAKNGQGDMAVANAIGSNVFDILLGLGIPWTLNGLIYKTDLAVDAENLVPLSLILIGTLIGVYFVSLFMRFHLTRGVGAVFFGFYFIFVAYNLAHEFNLISY